MASMIAAALVDVKSFSPTIFDQGLAGFARFMPRHESTASLSAIFSSAPSLPIRRVASTTLAGNETLALGRTSAVT
ncbi:MAG: hypothetical protein A2138_17740 [Deltaproteobacteria bacterium RBG_16_71_12]|nr:MAG: hypothetical protein A2138_17740 [Deltaproteobacteria bacterium RBG_16_71_12]